MDNCTVGVINTGHIDQIITEMRDLENSGQESLAQQLTEFTATIVRSNELTEDIKNLLIEQIAFMSAEMNKDSSTAKTGMLKRTIDSITKTVATVQSLETIWETIKKLLT